MHDTPWYAHTDWAIDNFKYMLDNFKPAEIPDPEDNNDDNGERKKIVQGTFINIDVDKLGQEDIVSTHYPLSWQLTMPQSRPKILKPANSWCIVTWNALKSLGVPIGMIQRGLSNHLTAKAIIIRARAAPRWL